MPTPAHALLTWSGIFGPAAAPVETWQFSLKSDPIDAATDSVLDGLAQGLETVYTANLAALYGSDVRLTRCEVVNITSDGKYRLRSDGSYERGERTSNVPGTSGTVSGRVYPLQTALTVTLTTARVGPSGKGRFFLPFPHVGLDAGYRIEDAGMTKIMGAVPEFVRDLQLYWGPPLVVASSKGFSSTVTGVRVGRVPDTMRSRRGDLIEAYQSEAL